MNRIGRRTGLRWATALPLFLVSGGLAAGTGPARAATPPTNLQPTPAFTLEWRQATAAYNYCHYALAYQRFNTIKARGMRLADPVLRFKFYYGLATSAYTDHHKRDAQGYAHTGITLYQSVVTATQRHPLQTQAIALSDIVGGSFNFGC